MKPICVACQRFYRPKRNGTAFVEMAPKQNGAPPGTQAPDQWQPYKLWMGDLWECQGCGHQTISGVAFNPIDEHYRPSFESNVKAHGPAIQINDC